MLSPPSWSCKQSSDFGLVTPTPHRVGSRCLSEKTRHFASGGFSASPLRRRSLTSARRCYACTVVGLLPVFCFSFMFAK